MFSTDYINELLILKSPAPTFVNLFASLIWVYLQSQYVKLRTSASLMFFVTKTPANKSKKYSNDKPI